MNSPLCFSMSVLALVLTAFNKPILSAHFKLAQHTKLTVIFSSLHRSLWHCKKASHFKVCSDIILFWLSPLPLSQRNQLRVEHRCYRGHPHRGLHPAPLRRGHHMLFSQQVWASHVHCRQLLRQVWALCQREGYWGGKSRFHVSLSFPFPLICVPLSDNAIYHGSPIIIAPISSTGGLVAGLIVTYLSLWMRMMWILAHGGRVEIRGEVHAG